MVKIVVLITAAVPIFMRYRSYCKSFIWRLNDLTLMVLATRNDYTYFDNYFRENSISHIYFIIFLGSLTYRYYETYGEFICILTSVYMPWHRKQLDNHAHFLKNLQVSSRLYLYCHGSRLRFRGSIKNLRVIVRITSTFSWSIFIFFIFGGGVKKNIFLTHIGHISYPKKWVKKLFDCKVYAHTI